MNQSTTLIFVTIATYFIGMTILFFSIAKSKPTYEAGFQRSKSQDKIEIAGVLFLALGWGFHLFSTIMRGIESSRIPLGNMYEYGSATALVAIAVSLVLLHRKHRNVLAFVTFIAILVLASSLLLFTEAGPVQPALRSYWLFVHVSTISGSSAILLVGFIATVLYLIRESSERKVALLSSDDLADYRLGSSEDLSPLLYRDVQKPWLYPVIFAVGIGAFTLMISDNYLVVIASTVAGAVGGILLWFTIPSLPKSSVLDDLAYTIQMFAFPLFTFGIVAGSIWAEKAWGRYWGWDPKETASFVTWLIYAAYLHARATSGWKGRRAAWILVIGFLALVFTYFIVNLVVVGKHSYATG